MGDGEQVAPDEYVKWLSPLAAVRELEPWLRPDDEPRAIILVRLRAGALGAAAYRAIYAPVHSAFGEPTTEFRKIDKDWWDGIDLAHPLWTAGEARFTSNSALSLRRGIDVRCFGIRFDHIGVALIVDYLRERPTPKQISRAPPPIMPVGGSLYSAPRISKAPPPLKGLRGLHGSAPSLPAPLLQTLPAHPAPRPRANPVTVREIKAWHRNLSRAEKTLGVEALWVRAKAAHPGRHLPRKLVEPYGHGRGNGHRAKFPK